MSGEIEGSREEILPKGMSLLHGKSDVIIEKICWFKRQTREEGIGGVVQDRKEKTREGMSSAENGSISDGVRRSARPSGETVIGGKGERRVRREGKEV